MKKLNKLILALLLLAVLSFILVIQFGSTLCALATITFLAWAGGIYANQVDAEIIKSGVDGATIGQLLDEKLTPKAKEKLIKLSGEDRAKLAQQFVREIGSDSGPISFKKYRINCEKQ